MKDEVEHSPCYQCLCLPLCRPQSITILRRKCPILEKYYFKDVHEGMYISYSRWVKLMVELKGIDV